MVAQRHPILPTVLAVATFVLTTNLSGQVTTGQISGSVLDPSRAAVNDALVIARSLETNPSLPWPGTLWSVCGPFTWAYGPFTWKKAL